VRYFRWRWNEDRGDEHADWGPSTWLWTEDAEGWSIDQWEVYDGGQVLHYHQNHVADEYGMLADQRSDPAYGPADIEELTEAEYRVATEALRALNCYSVRRYRGSRILTTDSRVGRGAALPR
jgi:hypothetical protein